MSKTAKRLGVLAALALAVASPTAAVADSGNNTGLQKNATVATVVTAPEPLGIYTCDSGDFCAYYYSNFSGGLYAWSGSDADWRNNYLANGASIDNDDMSWWNRGDPCAGCDAVRVFDGVNFASPRTICLTRGQSVASNSTAANRGSSHSWYGSC